MIKRSLHRLGAIMAIGLLLPVALLAKPQDSGQLTSLELVGGIKTVTVSEFYKVKLTRQVAINVKGVSVEKALRKVAEEAGLKLSYRGDFIPDRKVTLQNDHIMLSSALDEILHDTNLDYLVSRDGFLVIKPVFAQETLRSAAADSVSGIVKAADDGKILPGVNILVKGQNRGTTTNMEGRYAVQASQGDTLVFSFVGFQTQEIPVGKRQVINVNMTIGAIQSEELVVVGYGSQRREDLTGSVASVSSDELEKSVTSTFDEALQGRVAGVMVTQNSGKPGGGISVHVRGVSSLNGNSEPLYVIDGVPISGEAAATTNSSGISQKTTNALATLNPQDIKSIEVLKDASATAIYGARAANGVVLITTKRGEAGQVHVSYDGYYGVQQLPQRVDVMNLQEFARFQNERAAALDLTPQPEFSDPSILGDGTDWQSVLFRDAPMQSHNIRLSGGNEKTQYMLSTGYFDQEGIAVASWFKRYSMRLNLDNQALDWLKIGTSLNLSRTKERINVTNSNIINLAVRQRPDIPVYAADGSWGGPSDSQFTLENPVGMAKLRENYRTRSQLLGNVYAEINFTEKLKLRNEFDGNFEVTNDEQFTPTYAFGERTNDVNSSYRGASDNQYWMVKNYLTYTDTPLEKLDMTAMIGHEAQETMWQGLSGSRENFPTNNVQELNAGDPATDSNSGYKGDTALESVFGRLNLNYDSRYLVTGTLRADGSSKFGPNDRWGYFPSFSVAWRPIEEAFLRSALESARIDNLKFRFGFGLVGNQDIGNYLYGSTLSAYATPWGSGFLPYNLANPDLKWEATKSYNLGMDLALFNQRIKLTVDAYKKDTEDLLLQLPLPPHAGTSGQGGFSSPTVNIGSIENKGIEFSLQTVNLKGPLVWNSNFVFSTNRNVVTKMNDVNSVIDRSINFTDVVSRTVVGEPVGQFYGYIVEGVFVDGEDLQNSARPDAPLEPNGVWVGDYKFKDLNGDGMIDENDRTFIGNPQPDFTFGIGNSFFYKNFSLSVFINGKYGNDIFNDIRRENENPNGNFGLLSSVDDYARIGLKDPNGSINDINNVFVKNPDTMVPRLTTSDANDNYRVSDRFVEDGSYLRVKNVTLGYSLPASIRNRFKLTNLRVYLKAENLFTISGYSGYDPEVGSHVQDPLLSGVDDGRYPSSRTFSLGINIGL